MRTRRIFRIMGPQTAALAALAVGCASEPTLPGRVEQVRSAYQQAAANEQVPKNASVPLYEARSAVERLEKASKEGEDPAEVEHLAYLAEQRIELAEKRAEAGAANAEIERLSKQRDELRIQARTQEAQVATLQAQQAREDAVTALSAAHEADRARQDAEQALDDAQQRAQALAGEMHELGTRSDARGVVMTLNSVLFATGKAELKPGAERVLGRVAELLNAYPKRGIRVEGHTDSVGSDATNLALSQARAQAVAAALEAAGVSPERIQARGLGEQAPLADNGTPSGRQQNRRVEIILAPAAGAPSGPASGQ